MVQLSNEENKNSPSSDASTPYANNIHIYPDHQNILNAYHNSQPISIMIDSINLIYAVSNDRDLSLFTVGNFDTEIMGHNYFNVEMPINTKGNIEHIKISTFGLLLPKLSTNDDDDDLTETGIYTVITSDWLEINRNKIFEFYHYKNHKKLFSVANEILDTNSLVSFSEDTEDNCLLSSRLI